jgi:excisionase family DNA binding protein
MRNGRSRSTVHAQTATTPKRLRSIAVGAEYADVSTKTIRRYIADGRLTGYRIGPRLVKIDLDDLDALVRRIPTIRPEGTAARAPWPPGVTQTATPMTRHRRHKNAPLKADQHAASSWAHLQPQLDDGTMPERRVSRQWTAICVPGPETRAPGYRAVGRTLRRCAGGVQGAGPQSGRPVGA